MPQILEFSFKNVCSYGNKKQSIPFGKEPTLTLIVGDNGAGKTTIGNALEFSWYGKTRKRKIKELANRYNGHLETYNKFMADDGRVVEIARGIDPAHFDLLIDGVPDNKAGKTKIDEYIENELIGLPFEVCANTMILSINDFKSFVKIKAEDKRKIVDRIFGIDILNKMNALLKEDLKQAREDLAKVDAVISHQNTLLAQSESQLAELKQNMSIEAERRKAELEGIMDGIRKDMLETSRLAGEMEAEAMSMTAKLNDSLAKIETAQAEADAEALSSAAQAEGAAASAITREYVDIENATKDVLNALDESYGKKIAELRTNADNAAAAVKRDLDAKLAEIESKYAGIESDEIKKRDEIMSRINTDLDAYLAGIEKRHKEKIKDFDIELDSLITQYNEAHGASQLLTLKKHELKLSTEGLLGKIALYEKNICPECETDLTTHFHENRKEEFERKIIENETECIKTGKEIDAVASALTACYNKQLEISENKTAAIAEYNEAVSGCHAGAQAHRTKADADFNNAKYAILQNKNIETSRANSEMADANLAVAEMREGVRGVEHEYDLKKQDAKNKQNEKMTESRDRHNAALNEKKNGINATKDARMRELSALSNKINGEYSGVITAKKQEAAVLRMKHDGMLAMLNLHGIELSEISAKLADNESVKSLESMVENIRAQMVSLVAEQTEHADKIKKCLATQELLVEDGIKKVFMKHVLPAMNATIKRVIDDMQYKYDFMFDEDFNAIITHMGHEISPESLSTGEEKMIDLIVVLTVMELIKMKHPKINVMFLDEIFASLDQINIERVIKILREFISKYGMTLFAISHTMMPKEYFDNVISVANDGMFSDMSVN